MGSNVLVDYKKKKKEMESVLRKVDLELNCQVREYNSYYGDIADADQNFPSHLLMRLLNVLFRSHKCATTSQFLVKTANI